MINLRTSGRRAALALAVSVSLLAAPAAASAASLSGSVGPGMVISMGAPAGPGTYTVTISDNSSSHNFHLTGPGVNKATDVPGTGTTTWSVTFQAGATYSYVCDVHPAMAGSFTVPAGSPAPGATTGSGSVAPAAGSGTSGTTSGATGTGTTTAGAAATGALPRTGTPYTTPLALLGYFLILGGIPLTRVRRRRRRARYIQIV